MQWKIPYQKDHPAQGLLTKILISYNVKKNKKIMNMQKDDAYVVDHTSITFMKTEDTKKSLEKSILYWNLIRDLVESKKSLDSELHSILLVQDQHIRKAGGIYNYSVRVKNSQGQLRRGQLDFYLLTEDGKFLEFNFFHEYQGSLIEKLDYYSFVKNNTRYYLRDLQRDLKEINFSMKLIYIILISPRFSKAYVFNPNHFSEIYITDSIPDLKSCEEIEDDIDKIERLEYEREVKRWTGINNRRDKGEVVHICPACDNEWNNHYCYSCGHPH